MNSERLISSSDASANPEVGSRFLWEWPLLAAVVLCLLSRVVGHFLLGVTYDIPEPKIYQLLDPEALKAEPFTSLYYMHIQPPILNALYALSLALPEGIGHGLLQFLSVFSTVAMMVVTYVFLRRFGYAARVAGVCVAIFSLLPQVWGYEHLFLYAQFEAVLLLTSMLFASNYLANRGTNHYWAFALCLLILGLTRSLFHIGWIAAVLLVMAGIKSRRYGSDKPALLIASLSLAMVGTVYAKNFAVFSTFSASSWLGISVAELAVPLSGDRARFPEIVDDFERRAQAGEFSKSAAMAEAADSLWLAWLPLAQDCGEDQKTPRVLCARKKSDGGPNMNHAAMLSYSDDLGHDALHALRLYPELYAYRARTSFIQFFTTPSWDFWLIFPSLGKYARAWNVVFMYGQSAANPPQRGPVPWWTPARYPTSSLPIFLLVFTSALLVLAQSCLEFYRYLAKSSTGTDWIYPGMVVILFLLVPNLINGVESQRIRYSIEPILFLALAHAAIAMVRTIVGRRASSSSAERLRNT